MLYLRALRPLPCRFRKRAKALKIAVSHFGNDPSNLHSPNDLQNAHRNSDLHRVVAYKWSYVEH
jgi:hypothetical protein